MAHAVLPSVVLSAGLALALSAVEKSAQPKRAAVSGDTEATVSLDVREADVLSVVQALADLGDVQAIFDPDIKCRLTLDVRELPLQRTLDLTLGACGLAAEREGRVLRVTTRARLTEEAKQQRTLKEARERSRPVTTTVVRLSYARAQELAPLVEKHLSPRGRVVFDSRTNTLFILD